jgi:protein TonB
MPTLQLHLNEYKKAPESAAPLDKVRHEATEPQRRPAVEPNALGLVLPIPAARRNGNGTPLTLPPTVKQDVFLNALLETPTARAPRRSPLEWFGAMGFHVVIVAALIIVPLYSTAKIHLNEYQVIPLVAPPPPPAPPPPAGNAMAPHLTHPKAKLNYTMQKLTTPTAIPKKISSGSDNLAEPAPDLGVSGGVAGGVPGGQIGGVIGGVIGGTGTTAPAPPPAPRTGPKVVHVGGSVKAPRQTLNVDPEYPTLARQVHLSGTVVVDAVIDERGNVVQARVVSGHPLLVGNALKAVLQWKYEPTTLNGQPVSVELEVQVHFNLNAGK